MSITTKQSADQWEVIIEGEVTLPCIAEVRETLLEALSATDRISLDLTKVTGVDISCLQIFCAIHKTSITREKEITFSTSLPFLMREAMDRAGYSRDAGCQHKMNGECLLGGATYG
jgi:anti-anti-sigma regulatory factor